MANIISFTIENFKSYKEPTTISFEAVDTPEMDSCYHDELLTNGDTVRLLNTAVIYGANASGKSNIIVALSALSYFVKESKRFDPEKHIRYEPFAFSSNHKNQPTAFTLDFIAEGVRYQYKFAFNKTHFLNESLTTHKDAIHVFERNENGYTKFNTEILQGFSVNETYLPNHLALSELSLRANTLIQSVYKEISRMNTIVIDGYYNTNTDIKKVAKMIHNDEEGEFTQNLKKLIVGADTGIDNLVIQENSIEDFDFPQSFPEELKQNIFQENKYEVMMHHTKGVEKPQIFPIQKESAGTRTLFVAGARALKALERGGVLAYDEMNIALHPLLFRRLVALFNNKKTNPKGAQLVVTTHDTILIDEPMLRADQVWFVEKSEKGESDLFSASDFENIRIDEPFGPWYRSNRLGARPNLKFFDTFAL